MTKLLHIMIMLLLLAPGLATTAHGAPTKDIRILIDVSGSMKRNDPDNLRVPALKLITGLLPRDSQAGVWTFGRYVNMLVSHGTVDDAWRSRAMTAAEQLNSHGLYTNLEATLADATWDWSQPAGEEGLRTVILLTDGYVDISPDQQENSASRKRILNEILPRLQRAGVTIHTIALADDADHMLLRQLATASGGRYEKASADGLERIFFHLFEEAAEPETLPLVDNTVLVDDSIEELTLLIFHRPAAPPTRLTTPHGIDFGAERLPPNVRWHHEERYDLITIDQPMAGTWRVTADTDPDNRVMVVTDLNVIATRLPENLGLDERYTFLVSLT
ncbi:MAG: VWA domain-containing protein, partial [Gammaproteobacteria bacterium]